MLIIIMHRIVHAGCSFDGTFQANTILRSFVMNLHVVFLKRFFRLQQQLVMHEEGYVTGLVSRRFL